MCIRDRLIRLAHLATESCFAPQEVTPDAVAEGTRLLDGLLADHPPPPRARRVLRSSA